MARPARAVAAVVTGTPAVQVGSRCECNLETCRRDQKCNAAAPNNSNPSADDIAPSLDRFASGGADGKEDLCGRCAPGVNYVHEVLCRRLLDSV